MKWFKHISDSLDDPFIQDLMDEFGSNGYLVFFGILEMMAREFDIKNPGIVTFTRKYCRRKLRLTWFTISTVLKFCEKEGRIFCNDNGRKIQLNCPKLAAMCDDWTQRQLRSYSEVTPKKPRLEVEADVEVEADLSKKASKGSTNLPSEEEVKEGSKTKIETYIKQIVDMLYKEKVFSKAPSFVNKMKKQNKNPRAILHVLSRCYLSKPEKPWAYCMKIIETENGNYNERDYQRTYKNDDK